MLKHTACHRLFFPVLIVSFFLFVYCNAEAANSCSQSGYLVVHINGINTLKRDARISAKKVLAPAIGSTYNNTGVKVILAYNPTHGALSDLADVFKQKISEYPGIASELIFRAITRSIFGNTISQAFQDFITKYHINKIKTYGYLDYSDDDLQDILGAIRSNITENQKILLVPHSQGNLYANAAYKKLTTGENAIPTTAIKIVGIASPAAYVAGNGKYLTSTNDLVIKGLRSLELSVLAANFTISLSTDDVLGHGLRSIYLNSEHEGRAELIQLMHSAMSSLSLPEGQGSQGPITVTLTWGAQPDVDLHVLEPDGTHVFYSNKQGQVGSLDVDDVDSYGPEHYFTTCSGLETGTYTIGVNYYRGSGPEIATVTISTPFGSVTRKTNLATAKGSGGNSSPIIVGYVKVTKSADNRYKYEIL